MAGMFGLGKHPPGKRHQAVLAGAMFIVLLACVGVAAILVAVRGGGRREAAALLGEVRERSLGAWWNGTRVQWRINRAGGTAAGWEAEIRAPLGDTDGFEGLSVQFDATTGRSAWQYWRLSGDAKQGFYRSVMHGRGGSRSLSYMDTRIRLAGDRLAIEQRLNEQLFGSAANVPAGYLPEGLKPLIVREVARRGGKAAFRTTLDMLPPVEGVPDFHTMLIEPADASEVDGASWAASSEISGLTSVYWFDDSLRLLRRELRVNGVREVSVPASLEELEKTFPSMLVVLEQLYSRGGIGAMQGSNRLMQSLLAEWLARQNTDESRAPA
jgi:hypothetical protein